ncbi:hypothetical protein TURU_108572 [Turdus rufiventris]|nr:hypothetical protein TURU_108572 [Turdus rufiventris]
MFWKLSLDPSLFQVSTPSSPSLAPALQQLHGLLWICSSSSRLKQEQMYVRDEFGKLLERERISSNEHLTRAILRERAATEEERQKAQRFVSPPTFTEIIDWPSNSLSTGVKA